MNLYVDLERPEVAEQGVPGFTLCGNRSSLAQTKYYSSQRSLILEFHADTRQTNNTGFRGIYRFLDKGRFTSVRRVCMPAIHIRYFGMSVRLSHVRVICIETACKNFSHYKQRLLCLKL